MDVLHVFGLERIANIQSKIDTMTEPFRKETIGTIYEAFEKWDFDVLIPDIKAQESSNAIECH